MRDDGSKLWLLVGLSFAYGIFHAAGPGHGKAVISSYMLANEVALRRGILLSFVSAFLQALTAIVVMTLVFLVLRGTSISMTDATWFLEVVSYALIIGCSAPGCCGRRLVRCSSACSPASPAHSLSARTCAQSRPCAMPMHPQPRARAHDHAAHCTTRSQPRACHGRHGRAARHCHARAR